MGGLKFNLVEIDIWKNLHYMDTRGFRSQTSGFQECLMKKYVGLNETGVADEKHQLTFPLLILYPTDVPSNENLIYRPWHIHCTINAVASDTQLAIAKMVFYQYRPLARVLLVLDFRCSAVGIIKRLSEQPVIHS